MRLLLTVTLPKAGAGTWHQIVPSACVKRTAWRLVEVHCGCSRLCHLAPLSKNQVTGSNTERPVLPSLAMLCFTTSHHGCCRPAPVWRPAEQGWWCWTWCVADAGADCSMAAAAPAEGGQGAGLHTKGEHKLSYHQPLPGWKGRLVLLSTVSMFAALWMKKCLVDVDKAKWTC